MTDDRRYGLIGQSAIKVPVRAGTTANITLSGTQTVDGVALASGDRVLVKNQTSSVNNGIYAVDSSTWSRAADCDGSYDLVKGTLVLITDGSTLQNTIWQQTAADPAIGTDNITFSQTALNGSPGTASLTSATATTINGAKTQVLWTFDDPGTRSDGVPGFAFYIDANPLGIDASAADGADADHGLGIYVEKQNYLTTTLKGAVAGQQVWVYGGYNGGGGYNQAYGEVFGGIWHAIVSSAHTATGGVFDATYSPAGVDTTKVGAQIARVENQSGIANGVTVLSILGTGADAFYAYEKLSSGSSWTNWLKCVDINSVERVKIDREGGLRTAKALIQNAQTGTTYQFVLDDAGKMVSMTNGSAIAATIPANATVAFTIGAVIFCRQGGAGQVTFTPAVGVTLRNVDSHTKSKAIYANCAIRKIDTNEWELFGSTAA